MSKFVKTVPHFKLKDPWITVHTTDGTSYEAIDGNKYTPQEILKMWDTAINLMVKEKYFNVEELLLNFLVFLGMDV